MIGKVMSFLREGFGFLLILPVRFYQVVLGPLLPKVCAFQPS
jgi:putative component of membrane protein insertase Oxa1/YidC/SpoIIIJ protein YidD